MVHDCSITERWASSTTSRSPSTSTLPWRAAAFPYTWKDDRPARVGLIPLGGSGADVRWFEVAPCYVFHPLNAHDDGDQVVLDVVRYDRMFDAKRLGPDDTAPLLWRWTIDTASRHGQRGAARRPCRSSSPRRRAPRRPAAPLGLRRHGPARRGRRDNAFGGDLVRIDGKTGDSDASSTSATGRAAGEWSMVPRHADAAEDDGWLVSLGYDKATDRGELVVLPAADPAAGPVARVILPNRIPLGFHGNWVAD